METMIGYTIRTEKAKIDYEHLHGILDDVVSLYLADNSDIEKFTSSMFVNNTAKQKNGASSVTSRKQMYGKDGKCISKKAVKKTSKVAKKGNSK